MHIDPGSPAATEYALPLDSARGVGAGAEGAGAAAVGAKQEAFGSGITAAIRREGGVTLAGRVDRPERRWRFRRTGADG